MMNILMKFNHPLTMSSREVAALCEKRHDHVLRDIENLNATYAQMGFPKVGEGYYTHPNTGNQQHREFLLTHEQCIDLITGYRADVRIRINRRWQELENQQPKLPQTLPEALRLAADLAEQNQIQAQQIAQDRPKVLFAEAVTASETCILVGELAKLIKQNGVDIGQNRLFQWLRENGFLTKSNEPTQRAMDLKLFEVLERAIHNPDGSVRITRTTKVTGKGQIFLVQKFLTKESA